MSRPGRGNGEHGVTSWSAYGPTEKRLTLLVLVYLGQPAQIGVFEAKIGPRIFRVYLYPKEIYFVRHESKNAHPAVGAVAGALFGAVGGLAVGLIACRTHDRCWSANADDTG